MDSQKIPSLTVIKIINHGPFKYIILAYDNIKDKKVIVKRIKLINKKLDKEFEILSDLKNIPNVIQLSDFFLTSINNVIIQNFVFPFIYSNLESYIEEYSLKNKHISITTIKKITFQLLNGINIIHHKKIIHRNINPSNILIDENENVYISGFSSAIYLEDENGKIKENLNPLIGTRYYMAPELLLSKSNYDYKIDMFSLGCLIAELFTLKPLFMGKNIGLQFFEYLLVLPKPENNYFKEFNLSMLTLDLIKYLNEFKAYSLRDIIDPENYYPINDIDNVTDLLHNLLNMDYTKRYNSDKAIEHKFVKV